MQKCHDVFFVLFGEIKSIFYNKSACLANFQKPDLLLKNRCIFVLIFKITADASVIITHIDIVEYTQDCSLL